MNSSSVQRVGISSKEGHNTPRSQISGDISLKSNKLKKKRRVRAPAIDLQKSQEKQIHDEFDKIQPIINTKEPGIDFDQGNGEQTTKEEKEIAMNKSLVKSLSDNEDNKPGEDKTITKNKTGELSPDENDVTKDHIDMKNS